MNILNKLFPDRAELSAARSEIESLKNENEALRTSRVNADVALSKSLAAESDLRLKLRETSDKLRETSDKLREQTDADLLLICERLRSKIIAGEKPTQSELSEHQRLFSQRESLMRQAALQNPFSQMYNSGYSGLSQALGAPLGGLFR